MTKTYQFERRAFIKREEFDLAVTYFRRLLIDYDHFADALFCPSGAPEVRYQQALKAFLSPALHLNLPPKF